MLLDLIYGGVGTGKTELCIELIERTMKKNPTHNAILTVPDQYSYTAEKRIAERLGGIGLNGIEVLTFSQFFRRYIKKDKTYLSAAGKQMLFYRAVSGVKTDGKSLFSGSADKPGFVGKVAELVSEMKRYTVLPRQLKELSEGKTDMLSRKLSEFADIYAAYDEELERGFTDADDDFVRLAEFIEESGEFKNTHIWFDGFADFLPQHYRVIRAFLRCAGSVHVSLCMEETEKEQAGVFSVSADTAQRLKKIAEDEGARIYEQSCENVCRTIRSPELMHLMKNWDNRRKIYGGEAEDISLFAARDLYSEVDYAAKKIIEEVKNGARYRDITLFCCGVEKYSHLIEAVFGDYSIPYFTDIEVPITEHPIILTVLAAFSADSENWSYESVFRYLRSGYVYVKGSGGAERLSADSIDLLENYVLRHGIRGKKAWLGEKAWEELGGVFDEIIDDRRGMPEDIEEINRVRGIIAAPFRKFYENASGRRSVRELSEALYKFLCDIHLYEGIEEEVRRLSDSGNRNEAEQMKQIWNFLMEVINQAVVIASEEKISRESYCEMIKSGLSRAVMQIIPSGIDSVAVSDAGRNSAGNADIVFFLGAIGGTMPNEVHSDGILSDADRKKAEEIGLEIAKDSVKKSKQEMFKLYRAVTSASRKIYLSYPTSDAEGTAMQPSAFVADLYRMFPKMKLEDNLADVSEEHIYNKKQAFLYIMRSVSDKKLKKNATAAAEIFKGDEDFERSLGMARYAGEYKKRQPEISAENARALYNDYHRYSVSRLNDYSACPFSYFIKHGLKAQEREIRQIRKFEIGSLLHYAVCEYCRDVEGELTDFSDIKRRWLELEKEESDSIAERIMEDISERILSSASRDAGKIKYILGRMKKILLRSVEIVRLSLSRGEYTAVCYEEKFQIDIEWGGKSVGLNGTIDRVDASPCEEEGKLYLRVIDYKSGNKSFDVTSISNSTDMQLVVYAIAATELYKKGALGRAQKGLTPEISGILYNKLRDDRVKCKEANTEELEKLRISQMKPDGIVVADKAEEADAAVRMDRNLTAGAKSEFMKLALTSKGDALDGRFSSAVERDKFNILMNYVKKTTVRIDSEIFGGKIEIKPSSGKGGRACRFCAYREICLYDPASDGERKELKSKDEAWSFMEEEVGKE